MLMSSSRRSKLAVDAVRDGLVQMRLMIQRVVGGGGRGGRGDGSGGGGGAGAATGEGTPGLYRTDDGGAT
jgi:hypothetical protein